MSSESKMFLGSVCLSDLNDQAKKSHSAFTRGANGKIYVNICVWLNSQPDRYGNDLSLQLSSKKEKRDSEGKIYVGNAKQFKIESGFPVTPELLNSVPNDDDLPF